MLCSFSVVNFRTFQEEATIDMLSGKVKEYPETLIRKKAELGGLPVCVLFGPNGSGKSNILDALGYVAMLVTRPLQRTGQTHVETILQRKVDCSPCTFNDVLSGKPTYFRITTRIDNFEYRYELRILDGRITGENLYRKTVHEKNRSAVYERRQDMIFVDPDFRVNTVGLKIPSDMPLLSYLATKYPKPDFVRLCTWFEKCIIRDYSQPVLADMDLLKSYSRQELLAFENQFNTFSLDIYGIRFDENRNAYCIQRKIDGKIYESPLSKESPAVRKLLTIMPAVELALREGRLMIADELGSMLHPLIVRHIIRMFTNRQTNSQGAQLLMASQDMALMKNTLLRRDEILLVSRNREYASTIYPLSDVRHVEKTSAYDKQYLEGRYGADPLSSSRDADFKLYGRKSEEELPIPEKPSK